MRGKIVNLCMGFMNIMFGILLLVYLLYIPQDITKLTVQELGVISGIFNAVRIFLGITVAVDAFEYYRNKDNKALKTSFLIGIFILSFIFIQKPFVACFSIISGILIIINSLRDNSVDIDSTTAISVFGLIIVLICISIVCLLFYKNIGQYIKKKENKDTQAYKSDFFRYITELDIDEGYINVKKDGKFGYINPNGNVVIDFEYDYASPFVNIRMYNKDFQVALVCKDRVSYIIMKNKRTVMSYMSESSNDNYAAKMEELKNIYKNTLRTRWKNENRIQL